jgi:hypothetical protein
MNDAYPDPIAEELPKQRLPRWVWLAAVPILLALLAGLAALGSAFFALMELPQDLGHDPYPEPTPADRIAVMKLGDHPAGSDLMDEVDLEELKKTHYENDTLGLDYECTGAEFYVYSSIDDERSLEDAEATYEILRDPEDPGYEPHDELLRWGDVSSFCTYVADGEPTGYLFVGRRGTRVIWVEWGGLLYEPMTALQTESFLRPIVERMGDHELTVDEPR